MNRAVSVRGPYPGCRRSRPVVSGCRRGHGAWGRKPGGYRGLLFSPICSGHSSRGLCNPGLQLGLSKYTARHLHSCFRPLETTISPGQTPMRKPSGPGAPCVSRSQDCTRSQPRRGFPGWLWFMGDRFGGHWLRISVANRRRTGHFGPPPRALADHDDVYPRGSTSASAPAQSASAARARPCIPTMCSLPTIARTPGAGVCSCTTSTS